MTMAFADYLALDGVNWSRLKGMRVSALQCKSDQERGDEDPTHFRLGRAVHAMALEPDRDDALVVYPGARRGKPWQDFRARHADAETILTQDEYDLALDMRDALVASSHWPALEGRHEHVLRWQDPLTGLWCKARLDVCAASIRELKSTAQPTLRMFAGDAAKFGYANQLCWYEWGARENGVPVAELGIVAVKSTRPIDVWMLYFGGAAEGLLEAKRAENRRLLDAYAECLRANVWPGECPADGVDIGEIWPRWDLPRDDDALDLNI